MTNLGEPRNGSDIATVSGHSLPRPNQSIPWLTVLHGEVMSHREAETITRAVDALPPMTDEQIQRVAELLMASPDGDSE